MVEPETLNLIEIFPTSTFFTFKGTYYEQIEGIVTGSSLSPTIVNILMDHFETSSLNNLLTGQVASQASKVEHLMEGPNQTYSHLV
jgi:hypothetical protein